MDDALAEARDALAEVAPALINFAAPSALIGQTQFVIVAGPPYIPRRRPTVAPTAFLSYIYQSGCSSQLMIYSVCAYLAHYLHMHSS